MLQDTWQCCFSWCWSGHQQTVWQKHFLSINLVHFVNFVKFRSVQKKMGKTKKTLGLQSAWIYLIWQVVCIWSFSSIKIWLCLKFLTFQHTIETTQLPNNEFLVYCHRTNPLSAAENASIFGVHWREILKSHSALQKKKKHNGIFNPYLPGFFYSKNPKMRDPIQVTLFKAQPYHGHSRRENATSSSGRRGLSTGHRSLIYQYRKYPKHSWKLTLGVIRPKQKFLGLKLAFMNV